MPLNTRPISTTLDILLGLFPTSIPSTISSSPPPLRRGLYRVMIRVATVAVPVLIAIVFPEFDRIMAFLGSGMCIAICVILPICYYFKILGHEINMGERVLCWFLLVLGTICAIVGTVWTYAFQFLRTKLQVSSGKVFGSIVSDFNHMHQRFLVKIFRLNTDSIISFMNVLKNKNLPTWKAPGQFLYSPKLQTRRFYYTLNLGFSSSKIPSPIWPPNKNP